MKERTFVFLDLDDTILDFNAAERKAIRAAFTFLGIDSSDEIIDRYSSINALCWERLERGEIERGRLMTERFRLLFEERGITVRADTAQQEYETRLCEGHFFVPGAEELLETLYGKYELYMTSNGSRNVQKSRIASAGIARYYNGMYISENIGFEKPDVRFFEYVFSHIEGFDRKRAIIVGDSLTSDIKGGINAGIKTCWFNPGRKAARAGIAADYTIFSLDELPGLLEAAFENIM